MMNYILIVLSIIISVMAGAISKYAGERFKNKALMYNVFNVFVSAIALYLCCLSARLHAFRRSRYTWE